MTLKIYRNNSSQNNVQCRLRGRKYNVKETQKIGIQRIKPQRIQQMPYNHPASLQNHHSMALINPVEKMAQNQMESDPL